jgi:dolichol-phosphate mannosyltransferase
MGSRGTERPVSDREEREGTSRPEVLLTVLVPVFNEEEVLPETYRRLTAVLEEIGESYEILFVDDGSRDGSRRILGELASADRRVKVVVFSRNFGQQAAMSAGLARAAGRAVVMIDADLQDPPEMIPAMLAEWRRGNRIVYTRRTRRKGETWGKRITAALFYRLLRALSGQDIPEDVGDYRLIDRRVAKLVAALPERNRYIRGLVSWTGCRSVVLDYVRDERFAGTTKYDYRRMARLALDALTAFSNPLRYATWIGFGLSAGSFLYLLYAIYEKLFTDHTVQGWTSLIVVSLFFHGVMLAMLGLMGEYVGRILEEAKGRPLYVVEETENLPEED